GRPPGGGGGGGGRGGGGANEGARGRRRPRPRPRRDQEAALERLDRARRERQLAERLDAIHLNRAALVKGRGDERPNAEWADREYEAAFREAGLGRVGDGPAAVAAPVELSAIRDEWVAALDAGAACAGGADAAPGRQRWLLLVLRRADPNPGPIRQRLRDPALWTDRAALTKLAETALAEKPSAQLPVALAERMLFAGAAAVPFLQRVQRGDPRGFWGKLTMRRGLARR